MLVFIGCLFHWIRINILVAHSCVGWISCDVRTPLGTNILSVIAMCPQLRGFRYISGRRGTV